MTTRRAFLGLAVRLSAVAVVGACSMFAPPKDLDLARTKASDGGKYTLAVAPNAEPLQVGNLHSWTIELRTTGGEPVQAARFTVDGGMPQHGHGYPTQPRVTRELGQGKYLLEGMKFSMPGWWTLQVRVDGPQGPDATTFNIVL